MDLIGVCKCCNKRIQITIEGDKVSNEIFSLENYKKYKDFKINRCPHCDYISEKLFTENPPKHIEYLLKSGNYEYVLDYDYIAEEVDRELWENDMAFNANEYEAYALICRHKKDVPGEIKALYKCINLKEALIRRFRKITNEECDDEDWSDINGAIENRIQASINVNLKEIEKAYKDSTDLDVFTKLIVIEAFVKAEKMKEAKELFENVKKVLDEDLLDYIKNILM